jgi:hypothetical protein
MLVRRVSILMACLLMLYACSDSDKEIAESKRKKADDALVILVEGLESQIQFKANLLFLKHEILSEDLKTELVDFIISKDPLIKSLKSNTEESPEVLLQRLVDKRLDLLAIDKVESLSIKYNVPVNKLAAFMYDYQVLKAIEDIQLGS